MAWITARLLVLGKMIVVLDRSGAGVVPGDIVMKLRQVEVLQGQGMSVAEAVRQMGVTQQTYYRWRRWYGGMSRCAALIASTSSTTSHS